MEIGKNVSAICENMITIDYGKSSESMYYTNFGNCDSINVVVSKNPQAPIGGLFTQKVYSNATLYIPVGSNEAYASATGWSNFTNIVEKDMSGVESTLADNSINISVENSNIIVNGTDNAKVEVYNVNGQCVYNGTSTTIPVGAKGLYIVKVNNTTHKVIL